MGPYDIGLSLNGPSIMSSISVMGDIYCKTAILLDGLESNITLWNWTL